MSNEKAFQHFLKAEHLLEESRIDEGIAELKMAVALAPNYGEAHHNLGVLLERKGQNAQAIAQYRKAVDATPHLLQAHLNLGALLDKTGQLKKAIASYQQSLNLFPESAELHYNLGKAFNEQGMLDEALAEYVAATRLKPALVQSFNNLGRALLLREDWLGAIEAYEQAINLDPDWKSPYFGLGCAYAKTGRTTEAIAHLRTSLRLIPHNFDTLIELGHCLLIQAIEEKSRESVRLALEALKEARTLQPFNFQVYTTMLEARKIYSKL